MIPLQQLRRRVLHDRLEDAHQRLPEVVVQVVLAVDREVVLHRPDRVLGLFVPLRVLRGFHDDVRDAIADDGRRRRVALLHPLRELDVRGFVLVRVRVLGEPLRDHEEGQVHAVHEKVRDGSLDVVNSARDVARD